MPTISEPLWPEVNRRIAQIKADFIYGTDSADVLSARLFGAGLRGQDLDAAIMEAKFNKAEKHHMKPEPMNVLVMERNHTSVVLRFNNAESAGNAVRLLRRQPNVLGAWRIRANHVQPKFVAGFIGESSEDFVTAMLTHL